MERPKAKDNTIKPLPLIIKSQLSEAARGAAGLEHCQPLRNNCVHQKFYIRAKFADLQEFLICYKPNIIKALHLFQRSWF